MMNDQEYREVIELLGKRAAHSMRIKENTKSLKRIYIFEFICLILSYLIIIVFLTSVVRTILKDDILYYVWILFPFALSWFISYVFLTKKLMDIVEKIKEINLI
jgi:hypothetical protein